MAYTVRIRNNQTGEIRQSRPYDFEFSHFWWTDGNFGCDCNRQLEFWRAGNEDETGDAPCGEGRFTVIEAVLEDGSTIQIDTAT